MGKVYLVGAGPGDPGLLTVKAKGLLMCADVVIYDALVSQPILNLIPATVEQINVGKRRGAHTWLQPDISELLVTKAREVAIVVRLKGGDPFMFGRGGEEMKTLIAAGVEIEVVPGITAGIAAPAYAGIPVTHREHSSSVLFVTGHEAVGKYRPRVDWHAVAKAAETVVIYMGIHNVPTIADGLLGGGKLPHTPVAIIQWGTTPRQHVWTTTLGDLRANPAPSPWEPPAIIVVGSVVDLRALLAAGVPPASSVHVL